MRGRFLLLGLLLVLSASDAAGQSADSLESVVEVEQRDHSPRSALRRAMILPGWGQIYNKQWLKLPIVYGGLTGFLVTAMRVHDDYVLYREAYQYKAFQERVDSGLDASNPRASFEGSYGRIAVSFGQVSSGPLRTQRDNLRRNRDLAILGAGVFYALSVIDAYVSAHLMDFDVGDQLSVRVMAVPGPDPGASISARF